MRAVLEEAVRQVQAGAPCVLVTVVRTKGSTPQKPGAKLLVRHDGSAVGTLGGGCVEGDLWFAAKELLRQGGGPQYRDYLLNEELAARDGLVCGGTMFFLLDPLRSPDAVLPVTLPLLQAMDGGLPVALATVLQPPPGQETRGAKLLVRQDGSTLGDLGSPTLHEQAVAAARRVMAVGEVAHVTAPDGTEVLVEGYTTPPTLILLGGGHIAKATAPLAATLGFRLFVVDDRPQFANPERFPQAERTVVAADYAAGLGELPVNANTYIVIATRGHRHDDTALAAAARTPARYVGLVGSKRKTLLIYRELLQRGVPVERLRELHAPIGLDLGARTPEEIALSILAEVLQVRLGGSGRPLQLEERLLQQALRHATAAAAE